MHTVRVIVGAPYVFVVRVFCGCLCRLWCGVPFFWPCAGRGGVPARVVGIPGGEATVKTYERSGATVTRIPANSTMEPMVFRADEVELYGKIVTVMRRY